MEQPLIEYGTQTLGLQTVAWICFCVLLIILVWYVASQYFKYKHKADNLPCENHASDIKNLTTSTHSIDLNLTSLNVKMNDVEKHLDSLQSSVSKILEGGRNAQFTQSHSPVSLNEAGKTKAENLGMEHIIDKNWDKISSIIQGVKNPYDIQSSFIVNLIGSPEKYIDNDSLDFIKRDAYENGIALIEYMRMAAILSRDKYFKEHNIEVGEVDKHDPTKN